MASRFAALVGRCFTAAALVVAFAACGLAAPRTAAPRSPATAGIVKLFGVDYVEAKTFFGRYGLNGTWLDAGRRLVLKNAFTKITLEADRAEVDMNGLRLFLGEPVVARNKSLFLSLTDAQKLFGAILRPSAIEVDAPAVHVIAIDPGHGGIDPGKENERLKLVEKKLTLDVALRLKKLLEAGGYKTVLTRTDDRHLSPDKATDLARRAEIANRAGADLFISIHFNAFVQPGVNGTETYIVTRPGQRSTGQDERDNALPANRMDSWNAVFGYSMHRQLLNQLKSFDRGLKFARYKVITLVNCPGVLVESGFLTNDAEGRKINTPAYRQEIAEAIAAGVNAYASRVAASQKK